MNADFLFQVFKKEACAVKALGYNRAHLSLPKEIDITQRN